MAGRNNDGFGTFRAEDGGDAIESRDEKDPVLADVPVEEWIEKQTFASTKDIPIPDKMADRVIGQDRALDR